MVDYSRWDSLNADGDADEEEGLQCTFRYPQGPNATRVSRFDVRPEVCREVGSAVHGDVVLSENGQVAAVIGVRCLGERHREAGARRLWCHAEGMRGAGLFTRDEKLRVVGRLKRIAEGGSEDGRSPAELLSWLEPTFSYPVGLESPEITRLDVREEVCLRVGGFRHGQVVHRPEDGIEAVAIGVARDPRNPCVVAFWFHCRGMPGAGVFDYQTMRQLVAAGEEQVEEAASCPSGHTHLRMLPVLARKMIDDSINKHARAACASLLAVERAKLAKERAELDEQRRRLARREADAPGSDIIELNVGGTPLSTTRATLCAAGEGSMLAAMFSGSWERGHKRDAQGRVFLDVDPYCFGRLLSALRLRTIQDPAEPAPFPEVDPDRRVEFLAVAKYLAAPLFEKNRFAPDSQVRVSGLSKAVEVNDNYGWLTRFEPMTQRWSVILRNGSVVSASEANLELVAAPQCPKEVS